MARWGTSRITRPPRQRPGPAPSSCVPCRLRRSKCEKVFPCLQCKEKGIEDMCSYSKDVIRPCNKLTKKHNEKHRKNFVNRQQNAIAKVEGEQMPVSPVPAISPSPPPTSETPAVKKEDTPAVIEESSARVEVTPPLPAPPTLINHPIRTTHEPAIDASHHPNSYHSLPAPLNESSRMPYDYQGFPLDDCGMYMAPPIHNEVYGREYRRHTICYSEHLREYYAAPFSNPPEETRPKTASDIHPMPSYTSAAADAFMFSADTPFDQYFNFNACEEPEVGSMRSVSSRTSLLSMEESPCTASYDSFTTDVEEYSPGPFHFLPSLPHGGYEPGQRVSEDLAHLQAFKMEEDDLTNLFSLPSLPAAQHDFNPYCNMSLSPFNQF